MVYSVYWWSGNSIDGFCFLLPCPGASEVAVVGVARACLTERSPATSPSQQLQASQHLMTCSVPRDFYFTCKVNYDTLPTGYLSYCQEYI